MSSSIEARTTDGLPPVFAEMLCTCGAQLGVIAADFAARVLAADAARGTEPPACGIASYQDSLPVYGASSSGRATAAAADVEALLDAYVDRRMSCCRTRLLTMRTLAPPS